MKRSSNPSPLRAAVISMWLITAVAAATVLFVGNTTVSPSTSAMAENTIFSTEDDARPTASASSVVLPYSADAGSAYQDSLYFLGDSLTAHLISRGVLSGGTQTKQVLAPKLGMLNLNSEITFAKVVLPRDGREVTAAEAVAIEKPPVLIVTLGTDWGVSYLEREDFKYCYSKLIRALKEASPDTKIVLQSIFPVTVDCKVLSNKKIDRANVWVRELAGEHGLNYLDTQSILKDSEGNLRRELCNSDDGIHLTTEAYIEILGYIRTHRCT
ncbi:MAG: hypothetical protein E7589_07500 [Ruminococcaceae bacterium]|nr:hypothetical protein [Oscillospiraceae bacterium]